MLDKFINQIKKYGNLSPGDVKFLVAHAQVKSYEKGEIILRAGEYPRNIYYVFKGMVRLYYNVDGKDKTAFFYNEGQFIWACNNQFRNVPTQKNYEAIEKVALIQLNNRVIQDLMNKSSQFELLTRMAKEEELIFYQQMIESFVTLSPKERYLKLMDTNKFLLQRVPQQFIASYLGITSESLSRIKKRAYTCA